MGSPVKRNNLSSRGLLRPKYCDLRDVDAIDHVGVRRGRAGLPTLACLMTMSYLRPLAQRLSLRILSVTRVASHLPRYNARAFGTSNARHIEPNQQFEAVAKALRGSKAWDAIASNPELQRTVIETMQVLKDEGAARALFSSSVSLTTIRRSRPRKTVRILLAEEREGSGPDEEACDSDTRRRPRRCNPEGMMFISRNCRDQADHS